MFATCQQEGLIARRERQQQTQQQSARVSLRQLPRAGCHGPARGTVSLFPDFDVKATAHKPLWYLMIP